MRIKIEIEVEMKMEMKMEIEMERYGTDIRTGMEIRMRDGLGGGERGMDERGGRTCWHA